MEFLKAQFARMQEQLGALSASQKMLTASLVTIMVMTLLWWSHWAADPEMVAVLNQSLSQDDIGSIDNALDAKGIPHKVVGDKVMVPADRQTEILAELGYSQALPKNFDTAFDDLVNKQSNWLDPPEKTDQLYLQAKERTLSMVISDFPGVSMARVVIDPTTERRFDNTAVQPSAMVTISTGRESDTAPSGKQLAEAAADVVSGASAGLLRSRINIIIDGIPHNVRDRDGDSTPDSDEVVDQIQKWEDSYRKKILGQCAYIQGLMVSVTVKLDTSSMIERKHDVDKSKSISQPQETKEQDTETTGATPGGGDPGVVANSPLSVGPASAGGGASGATSSDTNNETTYANDHYQDDQEIKQGPGNATVVAASVRVPRSYFVNALKATNGGKDPDDASLTAFTNDELKRIQEDVKACTGLATDDAVVVGTYVDTLPSETPATAQAAVSPMTTALSGHTKEIGVGVLAAVSLFMVSMMVRKTPTVVPVAAAAEDEEDQGPRTLDTGQNIVGNVGEGKATLDALELDDESVKAQQILDQVQEMVTSNPDGAANLVKRWLNRA